MKNKISITFIFVFITFVSALAQQKDKNITSGISSLLKRIIETLRPLIENLSLKIQHPQMRLIIWVTQFISKIKKVRLN